LAVCIVTFSMGYAVVVPVHYSSNARCFAHATSPYPVLYVLRDSVYALFSASLSLRTVCFWVWTVFYLAHASFCSGSFPHAPHCSRISRAVAHTHLATPACTRAHAHRTTVPHAPLPSSFCLVLLRITPSARPLRYRAAHNRQAAVDAANGIPAPYASTYLQTPGCCLCWREPDGRLRWTVCQRHGGLCYRSRGIFCYADDAGVPARPVAARAHCLFIRARATGHPGFFGFLNMRGSLSPRPSAYPCPTPLLTPLALPSGLA